MATRRNAHEISAAADETAVGVLGECLDDVVQGGLRVGGSVKDSISGFLALRLGRRLTAANELWPGWLSATAVYGAISLFLSAAASSSVLPLTHSVTSELEAMAEPQP